MSIINFNDSTLWWWWIGIEMTKFFILIQYNFLHNTYTTGSLITFDITFSNFESDIIHDRIKTVRAQLPLLLKWLATLDRDGGHHSYSFSWLLQRFQYRQSRNSVIHPCIFHDIFRDTGMVLQLSSGASTVCSCWCFIIKLVRPQHWPCTRRNFIFSLIFITY